jgi:DNA-binding NarL/FixJ family response regulator
VGLRILIVDDNQSYLRSARELLEREGLEVVGVADDGVSAQERAAAVRAEVALVDVDLGLESGAEVAAQLAGAHPALRIILISAYPEEDLPGVLAESPALGFIHKPDLSRQAVEELLGG